MLISCTIGAEKMAPPGIGRSPMRAGKRARFKRAFRLIPLKESRRRFICPVLSIEWLRARISVTTTNSVTVCCAIREPIMDTPICKGERPNQKPSRTEPAVSAAPRETRDFIKTMIRIKVPTSLMSGDRLSRTSMGLLR